MNKNIEYNNEFTKYVSGGVFNSQNLHMWQNLDPHVMHQSHHQHRFSVNMWAGVIGINLVGLYLLPTRITGDL